MQLFKKLSEKLISKKKIANQGMIKPIDVNFDISKNEFLDNMTRNAVKLYERQCDIKNFTQLALSDPENTSHIDKVNELFEHGILDPLEDEKLDNLSNNKRFLRDLGLSD